MAVLVLALAVLAVLADWQGAKPALPCWLKSEQKIAAPYGIAVANVAVVLSQQKRLSSNAKSNLEEINQSLFDLVSGNHQNTPGEVGVGRTCAQDFQTIEVQKTNTQAIDKQAADKRSRYLSDIRDSLGGELATSLILTPTGQRFTVEVELSIGSREKWNEAQELAGYYTFKAQQIGSLEIRDSTAKASLVELLRPYLQMLRSIASYAATNYESAIESLEATLAAPLIPGELKKLAYVLKGNSQGRLGKPGSLDDAEASFKSAQAVDANYPRAIMGLAEVDYQRGLALLDGSGSKCTGTLTSQAQSHLEAARQKYLGVIENAKYSNIIDVDARAKYGTGRIHACLALLGDKSQVAPALQDLKEVTSRFESNKTKTWLMSAASGAYGELALVNCNERQRKEALANYDKAFEWAVDDARAKHYDEARGTIRGNAAFCS